MLIYCVGICEGWGVYARPYEMRTRLKNKLFILTRVTRSSASVRLSSAEVLSARSWARSNSCDVVKVDRPKVVW